ncbi:WbqC family protein [uncultured Psychroserpens sp.]|uniref:WbqC family protein n=1 Tax=uncultured Psychroserpens sp. TaxID=255436 RepID=UPI0026025A59|nr:WbqC family protein [uncultured Psychroserpens sp.]
MTVLLHPTYFPNIAHFVALTKAESLIFEVCDNYQKQTYRNRAIIYGANGRLDLNVPVHYTQKNRQLSKAIDIFSASNWQDLHLKSLESAYRASPFFEYYIDDIKPIFEMPFKTLIDLNFKSIEIIFNCLQLPFEYMLTRIFELEPKEYIDARPLANSRKEIRQDFQPYDQVFDNKHGFIKNLSILDLLFNEGPNTITYLESQRLNL